MEAYELRASYGAPDFEVEGWVTSYAAIATGEMDVVSDTVSKLTGHPAYDAYRLSAPTLGELPTPAQRMSAAAGLLRGCGRFLALPYRCPSENASFTQPREHGSSA